MKAKEAFALALRIIGVLGIMYIARHFAWNPWPGVRTLIVRLVCIGVGVYFVRGAALLVNFAYPESAPAPTDKPSA